MKKEPVKVYALAGIAEIEVHLHTMVLKGEVSNIEEVT